MGNCTGFCMSSNQDKSKTIIVEAQDPLNYFTTKTEGALEFEIDYGDPNKK